MSAIETSLKSSPRPDPAPKTFLRMLQSKIHLRPGLSFPLRAWLSRTLVFLQWVLVGFSPLLHAHSAEPMADPAGVHMFIPQLADTHTVCMKSGQVVPICTVEVAEGRSHDDSNTAPPALLPWIFGVLVLAAANQTRPLRVQDTSAPPNPCCERAAPQAP